MSQIIGSTYEIYGKIGAGGGGKVYLARHKRLDKKVILKEDKRKLSVGSEMLRREVDILKHLSHSHIPQVYDFFVEDGNVYTVMEFIEGESLDRPLKRGETFSQPQVIDWAVQLLEALSYLHRPIHGDPPKGYVHSDIKPANLMRTSQGEIYLIDFNIALAIGEENAVGCSAGYASPEHYGYDYSFGSATATDSNQTAYLDGSAPTLLMSESGARSGSAGWRTLVPDARSDIYSVGATLYHLLSGKKPARNAVEVVPLSEKQFSPQIVKILSKAMNPNPDLRYQTADEMRYAFTHLWTEDPRVRKGRRNRIFAAALLGVFLATGATSTFVGLKRMQTTEQWLKFAEYSRTALTKGNPAEAVAYAIQALPKEKGIFTPGVLPEAQYALAKALGVYDLSDGFKIQKTVELSSEPLSMAIGPDGGSGVCICSDGAAVFDTETAEILTVLPTEGSALAEVEYLDNHTIVYAGKDGIRAYDFERQEELWSGEAATAVSISEDKSTVAALYRDGTSAVIYDALSGQVKSRVDFDGKGQSIRINPNFASLRETIFELNGDGTFLGVSFEDGSLKVFDLQHPEMSVTVLESGSGYTHFEGGFYQNYFAFSASNASESLVAAIDAQEKLQMGGFREAGYWSLQTDEYGICLQSGGVLVEMDLTDGGQKPLASVPGGISHFARDGRHIMTSGDGKLQFFDGNAKKLTEQEAHNGGDFIRIAGGTGLAAGLDSPYVSILRYKEYPDRDLLAYDSSYEHDETRLSADGKTVMLFSYRGFRIYKIDGELVAEVSLPDSGQVYDQQFIREGEESFLTVTYNDGRILTYSGADGSVLKEETGELPDLSLNEEFFTDTLRIEAPLHGTAVAYDRESGRVVKELEKDAYLTYVTQAGDYLITQYATTEGDVYGLLLNGRCEKLAYLPGVRDVVGEELLFDYGTGKVRKTPIYELDQLKEFANEGLKTE
ncbi:MAG: protein kinase [Lachnospiraceae bacterium]|nr:protein kinase [Lachnospiraceae bacterium]